MEIDYQEFGALLERQNCLMAAIDVVMEEQEGNAQNHSMSDPLKDDRVTLSVGGADSVLFSDN